MSEKRRDSKNRILGNGTSQRKDGRFKDALEKSHLLIPVPAGAGEGELE